MRRILLFLLATAAFPHDVSLIAMRRDAEVGDAKAQYSMGLHFLGSEGMAQDLPEAVKWWRMAAEQGHAAAQAMIGICFETGSAMPKDSVQAGKWYRRAADQGHAVAQYHLGNLYYRGEGVPMDCSEALKLFRKSAEAGFVQAQYDLGSILINGDPAKGIERDLVQAYVWSSLAGSQGNEMAQKNVVLLGMTMTANQKAEASMLTRELSEKMSKK